MPRIRTIKPEFFTSIQVADCSTTSRLLFLGSWIFCDDRGVHPWSAKLLKMEVFPGDDMSLSEVEGMMVELFEARLIDRFSFDGQEYFVVNGWNHQKIEKPRYRYPDPAETMDRRRFDDGSTTNRRQVADHSTQEPNTTEPETTEPNTHCPVADSSSTTSRRASDRTTRPRYTDQFETFWNTFPATRRTKKSLAFKRWQSALKLVVAEDPAGFLIQRAADYAASDKGRSEFAEMPSTWLSGGAWDDPPEAWQNPSSAASRNDDQRMQEALER